MGWRRSSSYAICAAHCLVVSFIFIGFRRGAEGQQYNCDRSSCGDLQIRDPFRLKEDPTICGDPNYELTTNCSLPLKFLPSTSIDVDMYGYGPYYHHVQPYFGTFQGDNWVSIMNCSKKLASESYQLFPCQTRNDSYVYGVVGNKVANLAPSCSFLSWAPTIYQSIPPEDIVQVIKDGFFLSWRNPNYCDRSWYCGDLEIRNPFYLKGEPCLDLNSELTCNSDDYKAYLDFASNQYLVKQINYSSKVIQVIDVALLSSDCSLPHEFLPTNFIGTDYFHFGAYNTSVSLMECSKKIAPAEGYQLFPCRTTNNFYMYGVVGSNAASLDHSCRIFSWMPAMRSFSSNDMHTFLRATEMLQVIQDGFFLSWEEELGSHWSLSRAIRYCLNSENDWAITFNFKYGISLEDIMLAVFYTEMNFPACFIQKAGVRRHERLILRLMISIIIIIDIVLMLIIWLIACRFVFAPLSLCIFVAHKFWSDWAQEGAVEKFLRIQQNLSPTRYAYTDIIAITRNFRDRLGSGGFGTVYRGELPGNHFIAVKLLAENSKLNGDDFISEVSTIGRIHHVNVIRLIGFCSDGSKRALIYDYMPNGSLEKYIFSSSDKTPNHYFSWKKLNSIALGVARGINYLHRGCDMTILHFDIKPQNILLDHRFRPKISDFGLAKVYPKDQNVVSFNLTGGTIGYIAPELVSRSFGLISHKSDVYSFGMLLLEMGAGRRNVNNNASHSSQVYYPSWVYDRLNNSINAMEEGIGIEYGPEMNEVEKKLYIVGFCCVQMKPSDRPSMSDVVQMLDGDGDALQLPPKPFFSSSPSISKALNFEITGTKELTDIDEDDSSFDEDDSGVNEDGSA